MKTDMTRIQSDYNRLIQILNFRLPPIFKKLGLIGAGAFLLVVFFYKIGGSNTPIVKDVFRSLILLFLLMASLSKDKFEDEFNNHIRFQSYVIAFVFTAIYAISIPLISIAIDFVITGITGDGRVSFYEISAFEVLFMLMGFQILFFESLKRFGRA